MLSDQVKELVAGTPGTGTGASAAVTIIVTNDKAVSGGKTVGNNDADRSNGTGTGSTRKVDLTGLAGGDYYGYDSDGHKTDLQEAQSLAHELIHAWHNMRGARPTNGTVEEDTIASGPLTENDIRMEQAAVDGVTPKLRKGHEGCQKSKMLGRGRDYGYALEVAVSRPKIAVTVRQLSASKNTLVFAEKVRNGGRIPVFLVTRLDVPFIAGRGRRQVILSQNVPFTTADFLFFQVPDFIRLDPGKSHTFRLRVRLPLRAGDYFDDPGRVLPTSSTVNLRVVQAYGVRPFGPGINPYTPYERFLAWQRQAGSAAVTVRMR